MPEPAAAPPWEIPPARGAFALGGGPVERVAVGGPELVVIAGPCVLEGRDHALRVGAAAAAACRQLGLPYVFKASFDKANRTAADAWRGPGLDAGLAVLAAVRRELGVPVTTDVHLPEQAAAVAEVVDLLQVPAFLSRQTDLLRACAATGRPVNVKKGQFLAPEAMAGALGKLAGAAGVMFTERGTTFGYGDLVVDMRSLSRMRVLGVPVCFDATHAVQRPAAAPGVDALFLEVHDDPDRAPSDGPNMVPLDWLPGLLARVAAVHRAARD